MNYTVYEKGLGIVVLGGFAPERLDITLLESDGIILSDEQEYVKQQTISETASAFSLANVNVFCDKERLQIGTTDIGMSERLTHLCADILKWLNIAELKGVGINPHIVIGFEKAEDHEAFVKHFIPTEAVWSQLYGSAFTSSIQIRQTYEKGNSVFESLMVRMGKEIDGIPTYSVDMNVHHNITSLGEVIDVCLNAPTIFDERLSKMETLIKGI